MDETDIPDIVIATKNYDKILYVIAQDARKYDELTLTYTTKYEPAVEWILTILREAFGWMETDRGKKEVLNTKCMHNRDGFCTEATICKTNKNFRCVENVRRLCKKYKQSNKNGMLVNYVTIEKAGGIRGM